jgi:signal transduction histidine kinase
MMGKDIYHFMDEKGREIAKELMQKKKQGQAGQDRFRYISKSGKEVWTNLSANPLFNEDGSYQGALAMVTDITLEMQHQREILKSAEERELLVADLIRTNKDLKQFSFITSHNFRAPLSNLIGLLTLVEQETLSDNNRDILEMFKSSTQHLSKTINDLSQILVIKNNEHIKITKIDIGQLLSSIKDSLAYELNNGDYEIYTNLEVEEIPFNKPYLESVLINLISNAIKYKSDERLLRIIINTSLNLKGEIVLTVQDNGLGIDLKRHQENLFGLYQKFHSNPTGSGLGLYLVKSQIISLGGTIEVESEVGKGTTFIITLKAKETFGYGRSVLNQY